MRLSAKLFITLQTYCVAVRKSMNNRTVVRYAWTNGIGAVGRMGFETQHHNHKDAKTRKETGFGGYFGRRKGFKAMVTIP